MNKNPTTYHPASCMDGRAPSCLLLLSFISALSSAPPSSSSSFFATRWEWRDKHHYLLGVYGIILRCNHNFFLTKRLYIIINEALQKAKINAEGDSWAMCWSCCSSWGLCICMKRNTHGEFGRLPLLVRPNPKSMKRLVEDSRSEMNLPAKARSTTARNSW